MDLRNYQPQKWKFGKDLWIRWNYQSVQVLPCAVSVSVLDIHNSHPFHKSMFFRAISLGVILMSFNIPKKSSQFFTDLIDLCFWQYGGVSVNQVLIHWNLWSADLFLLLLLYGMRFIVNTCKFLQNIITNNGMRKHL